MPRNLNPANPANPYADYTVDQLYEFLSSHALPRSPEGSVVYSNLGVGLLGHILARHTGMSYEALVAERITRPLGMDDTGIDLNPDERERLAPGHSGGREVPGWDIPTLAGAGALRSTADDLLLFLSAHLGFVETPLADAMQRTTVVRASAGPMGDARLNVGLGWHIRETDDLHIVWHNGGTGGYKSNIAFDPAAKRGVVVLTNSDQSVDDIAFHLLDPSVPLTEPREVVDVAPEVLERYVGTYQLAPAFSITITMKDGQLFGQATGQPQFAMFPASETRFFLKVVEAEITFDVEEDGTVSRLTLHQHGRDMPGQKIK